MILWRSTKLDDRQSIDEANTAQAIPIAAGENADESDEWIIAISLRS